MSVRIRLSRRGRRKKPVYHIVAADKRAPRDGRYLEKLGTYDPTSRPKKVNINFDRALYWLQQGAQPSDTCKTLLSNEGVFLKKHLLRGVQKNVITEQEAEDQFNSWLSEQREKQRKVQEKIDNEKQTEEQKRLEEEKKINEKRSEELLKKKSEISEAVEEEQAEASTENQEEQSTNEGEPEQSGQSENNQGEEQKSE